MLRVDCKEKAEMKSALLTADWQFKRPTEKERGVVEDVAIGRRLAGLSCRLRVFLERNFIFKRISNISTQHFMFKISKRYLCICNCRLKHSMSL